MGGQKGDPGQGRARNPWDAELDRVHEDAVFIIGAGHFGARAARILSGRSNAPIFVVDPSEEALAGLSALRVNRICHEGIQFLLDNFQRMKDASTLVPALPLHLAYEWLIRYLPKDMVTEKLPMPGTGNRLPNVFTASEGSTLVSYADFLCPDDCPEPVHCTVTGEKREQPLFALLRGLRIPQFQVHIIQSHQLAPGLGGYPVGDLRETAERVMGEGDGKWVLGTACKCHGILTAFTLTHLSQRHKDATVTDPNERQPVRREMSS